MLADALTKVLVPLSFVACGDERTPPRVRDFRLQHKFEDNLADALRAHANSQMAIGSQLIRSAESHSGRCGPCTD